MKTVNTITNIFMPWIWIFNQQIRQLINQEEIDLPSFNFETERENFEGEDSNSLKIPSSSLKVFMPLILLYYPKFQEKIFTKYMFRL